MEIRFSKASYDDLDEIEDYLLNEMIKYWMILI